MVARERVLSVITFSEADLDTVCYVVVTVAVTYFNSHRLGAIRKQAIEWILVGLGVAFLLLGSARPVFIHLEWFRLAMKALCIVTQIVLIVCTYRSMGLALFSRKEAKRFHELRSRKDA